ncbi:hypothetical protein STEG23_004148, partial [Scotinomys teguina]
MSVGDDRGYGGQSKPKPLFPAGLLEMAGATVVLQLTWQLGQIWDYKHTPLYLAFKDQTQVPEFA